MGPVCLLDAVSSMASGCLAALRRGEERCVSLHPACFPLHRAGG